MINKKLKAYILADIRPIYHTFDNAHNTEHFNDVIQQSLKLAKKINSEKKTIDVNMVYTIAAFHDLGVAVDRETHHLESAKILRNDDFIKWFYTKKQIDTMAEAIEDHRASGDTPRNVYGKIISDGDRIYDYKKILTRCIKYRLDLDEETQFIETRKHIFEKYSSMGYLKEFYFREKNSVVQEKFDLFCSDDDFAKHEFNKIRKKI